MQKSSDINELAAALAKVQGVLPPVPKTHTASLKGTTKDGRPYEYEYKYAALDAVFDCCRRPLSENGLAVVQTVNCEEGRPLQIETTLMHTSGQWVSSAFPLAAARTPQDLGGQITYYRRYAFSALVGIVTEDDDDGQQGGNQGQDKQRMDRSSFDDRGDEPSQSTPPPEEQGQAPNRAQSNEGASRPNAPEKWVEECSPLFSLLKEEERTYLLKKYGNAQYLSKVSPALLDKFKNELLDLSAQND